jgi:hypothetical protein
MREKSVSLGQRHCREVSNMYGGFLLEREGRENRPTSHPMGLALLRFSALEPHHTEILCKRISWMVVQTIVRQLISVVNTSIWSVRCLTLLKRLSMALVVLI